MQAIAGGEGAAGAFHDAELEGGGCHHRPERPGVVVLQGPNRAGTGTAAGDVADLNDRMARGSRHGVHDARPGVGRGHRGRGHDREGQNAGGSDEPAQA